MSLAHFLCVRTNLIDIFDVYLAVGRYQEVIELSTATLKAAGGLEEAY